MANILIAKRIITYNRLLDDGITLPKTSNSKIIKYLGKEFDRGAKEKVSVIVDGMSYDVTLTNVKYRDDSPKKNDDFQFRYASNKKLVEKLMAKFSLSASYIAKDDTPKEDKTEFKRIIKAIGENLDIYAVEGSNNTFIFDCHPKKELGKKILERRKGYTEFLKEEEHKTIDGYVDSIDVQFVKDVIERLFNVDSIYLLEKKSDIMSAYEEIRKDPLDKKRANRQASCSVKKYGEYLSSITGEVEDDVVKDTLPLPEQIIYYGTPGCGKSHYVNGYIEEKMGGKMKKPYKNVFRTTFHPDTDYASFVGTFKPMMVTEDGKRKIEYDFAPQVFTDAYVYAYSNPKTPTFLIIEEINRGNCAQIFGDLFQLLDRDDETGISEYPIKANNDLKNYLIRQLGEDNEGIINGELRLPRNLNIIATMNTSDQSLFPMDSAFKRRWSWKYMKIDYKNKESEEFKIVIDEDNCYSWNDFLKKVNNHIYTLTKSEDKQLGNFFIKGEIDKDTFISKVMFYLWSEICKEEVGNKRSFYFTTYRFDDESPKDQEKWEFKFSDLFGDDVDDILIGFMKFLKVDNISEE